MPNAGDVANKYLKSACGNTPYITIGTGIEVRLYLWYFTSQPTFEERWVEHKGQRRRRRYYHSAKDKICLSQIEPGETTEHSYVLPFQPIGTVVWLVYADTCNFNSATFTSPIWSFTYVPCTGLSPSISRSHTIGEGLPNGVNTNLDFNTFINGNPAMEFNSQFTSILVAGLYTIQFWATVRADIGATPPSQTGTVFLFWSDGSTHELGRANISLEAPRATMPIYIEGRAQMGVGDIVWLEGTTTSGGLNQLNVLGSDQSTRLLVVNGQV
jgi:hypothetical protein